ncbi:uncharacterized protein LOC143846407 [Tasmannia lanceolata]|uniref:uncharacterized protein LOC143846407 n=1 Tax=Tasmannia lanceolata TaxID=3420 RepID=UPI004062BA14
MEKYSDFEDWEFLPDKGFLDLSHEDGKSLLSREKGFDTIGVVDMNYFICPSPNSRPRLQTPKNSSVPSGKNQLVSVPIQLELALDKNPDGELVKEIGEVPMVENRAENRVENRAVPLKIKDPTKVVEDQDAISLVFFKKMNENEFVDMKMDSPKSSNKGLKPQIEVGPIQFEEEEEAYIGDDFENKPTKMEADQEAEKNYMGSEIKGKRCWEDVGINICGCRVTGIGALCSIGVAAATICICIFGNHQRNMQQKQNQKLRFQIYNDEKIIKQVVHHATKLNEAVSVVRFPLARAQITFGGYYDGL